MYIESSTIGEKINSKIYLNSYDYLFCYRSYFIIDNKLLKKIKEKAINFHLSTPEYRGTGCINYALFDEKKVFWIYYPFN